MIALLAVWIALFLPDLDIDGDGYGARVETAAGCSNLDRGSFPHCFPDVPYPASCGASIPGADLIPCAA